MLFFSCSQEMLVTGLLKIKYFQGLPMSALPQRTQILIKDLLFQKKYNLSHSQTDLMAYLVNVSYWAICVDGYFVISTSKIKSDLPEMGEKTIEASLKVLKDLGLIYSKIVEVKSWKGKPKLRGIQLSNKGKEYNAKLILPTQDKRMRALEQEIKELKETIENLTVNPVQKENKKEETLLPIKLPQKEAIEPFIETIKKRFSTHGKPICNAVPQWEKETIFYINSYNKLSLITKDKTYKQLSNPSEIYHFWQWLFLNPERIGDTIDFSKTPTIKVLEKRFLNQIVIIGKKEEKIYAFVSFKNGVKIKVENQEGKVRFIVDSSTGKEKIFSLDTCQDILFGVLK